MKRNQVRLTFAASAVSGTAAAIAAALGAETAVTSAFAAIAFVGLLACVWLAYRAIRRLAQDWARTQRSLRRAIAALDAQLAASRSTGSAEAQALTERVDELAWLVTGGAGQGSVGGATWIRSGTPRLTGTERA